MTPVRCCCVPQNLIGHIPLAGGLAAGLELRELTDGSEAFSSGERPVAALEAIPGFVRDNRKGGTKKTWRKTWRKK